MSQNEPLVCTKEEEIAVLELRGRTPDSFRDDVEIVKNWIKTQPHFPEMPREYKQGRFETPLIVKFQFQRMKLLDPSSA